MITVPCYCYYYFLNPSTQFPWKKKICLASVIFHGLCCEFGLVLLTQNHIVHLVSDFIRAGTSRSVAALTSVHCAVSLNFFSNLLMLLGVHPLFGNSVLNCLALYLFN